MQIIKTINGTEKNLTLSISILKCMSKTTKIDKRLAEQIL